MLTVTMSLPRRRSNSALGQRRSPHWVDTTPDHTTLFGAQLGRHGPNAIATHAPSEPSALKSAAQRMLVHQNQTVRTYSVISIRPPNCPRLDSFTDPLINQKVVVARLPIFRIEELSSISQINHHTTATVPVDLQSILRQL